MVCASRAPASTEAAVAEPAADSVRSMSPDSVLIWSAASVDAVTSVACASRALVRIELAAPVPTAVRARSTSDEVSFSCAPTSEETASSDCCAARAPVWMVSLVLTTRLVSERSASSTCDLMPADSSSARAIRSSLACRPLLSMRPATASTREPSRSSNWATRVSMSLAIGADLGLDALMDFLEPRGDGVGQMRAAAVDGFGDGWRCGGRPPRSPARCRRSARR